MTDTVLARRAEFSKILDPQWLAGRGHLAQSIELEEKGPDRLVVTAIMVLAAALGGFLIWAALTTIGQVAPASGEVTPVGSVKRVQHLEGGIIAGINVREGDLVDQGQVLMELHSGAAAPELEQMRVRLAALELQEAQLLAHSRGESSAKHDTDARYHSLVAAQGELLRIKKAALESQEAVLRRQVLARRAELNQQAEQAKRVREQIAILSEQISIRAGLVEKGYASRMSLMDQQRELARIQAQLAEIEGQMNRTRETTAEAEARIAELLSSNQLDGAKEIGKIKGEIAELREGLEKSQDRVERLTIRSPVRGIVKGLQTETVGGVVAPGSTLLEVIPVDAKLMVEARIQTKDIGFVHPHQKVTVKVETYDYTRFGAIDGELETVSATTFKDDKGNPFYRARIKLNKNYVGADSTRNFIVPGMTVVADISTGERTVLGYLLNPIVRGASEALRER